MAAAVAVLLLGGYAAADAADAAPGVLTLAPAPVAPALPVAPGAAADPPRPTALPQLDPSAPPPDPAALAAAVTSLLAAPALRGSARASVVDATTGRVLLDAGAAEPRTPASVAKLLTAAAALSVLGPDTTLPTRVVAGTEPGTVVLVGGGDQLLSAGAGDPTATTGRAGLADLADAAAAALRERGAGPVRVLLDDSLTGGSPQLGSGWGSGDVAAGYVAPLTSVAVDAGRTAPGRYAARTGDPALAAADRLTDLLVERGAAVDEPAARTSAPAPTPTASSSTASAGTAPAPGALLAEVRSAPVADVVAVALAESDNTVAESLARLVGAAASRPAGFAESAQAVLAAVSTAGVDTSGAVLADGSGLSAGSRVPPAVFTGLLAAAASERSPLAPLLPAVPVGGLSGTLAERFTEPGAASAAAGRVRAKTGSLTGVSSLVGTVVDDDGRLLAFAVLADGTGATDPARAALDDVVGAVAACGCRAATG
ncbi:D-alanyl-D-alanine carboxypeptidase/D-alanyl-D-alanine-endopeptidase [Quadrisphaera sp. INWT6]|nr:D-alanyl-D-alanine carboxypeptidase/D-alanyl-D-alanine-endopeptidase [Quadrisphaera sp. INWT6]